MPELIRISTEKEYGAARELFLEYAKWLGIDLGFQKFEEELLELRTMYADKYGGIILCKTIIWDVHTFAYFIKNIKLLLMICFHI